MPRNDQPVLSLPPTPLADRFATHQPRYPLELMLEPSTWLLYLDQENGPADSDLFGADYGFSTASSPSLVNYFTHYAIWANKNFTDEIDNGVVEIGCNDGTLLQHFTGTSAVGVDPCRAAGLARAADPDLDIINEPFSSDLATDLNLSDCLVIANNVIAHVKDLDDTLLGIKYLVGERGAAVLEFGYAGDLIANADYPLVYHEHRRFFSFTSLVRTLRNYDLYPVSVMRTPQQGGSLRVTVRPDATAEPDVSAKNLFKQEEWLRHKETYTSLQGRVDYLRNKLLSTVLDEYEAGHNIALLGASAKATTLIHSTGIEGMIEFAEDLTLYKHGKVMPGTEIPIVEAHSKTRADTWLLGVPNYLGSLLRQHPDRRFITTPDATIIN